MANTSFTQGEWEKDNLKFHTALKRKYISVILKQILGHFSQYSNSEIKWVSKRNNGSFALEEMFSESFPISKCARVKLLPALILHFL